MTITEKAAYIRGLAEGLALDAGKPETKLFNAIMDLLDDLTLTVSDLEDEVAVIGEQVVEIDEDLGDLEDEFYDDEDEWEDDDCFEIECPNCGELFCVDGATLEDGDIKCPNCDEAVPLDDMCECGECKDD